MKQLLIFLLVFALVSLMGACARRESQTSARAKAETPAQMASWKIDLQKPPQIWSDKPAEFRATVKDSSGQAVSDAVVELSLTMKTMDMGENKARLTQVSPGVYKGKATFTMAGPWDVEVRSTKAGLTAIERFPCTVEQPQ